MSWIYTSYRADTCVAQAPGGGSIGTYKELCALATDLGQPELVYRFMVGFSLNPSSYSFRERAQ